MVGVRLHSLIYSAVMGIPMIGISYDPKVDSFLASIQQPTLCDIQDFTLQKFQTAFRETLQERESIRLQTETCLSMLISKLDKNEELIHDILEKN